MFTRMRSARPSDRLDALRRYCVGALGGARPGESDELAGPDGSVFAHPADAWQVLSCANQAYGSRHGVCGTNPDGCPIVTAVPHAA